MLLASSRHHDTCCMFVVADKFCPKKESPAGGDSVSLCISIPPGKALSHIENAVLHTERVSK